MKKVRWITGFVVLSLIWWSSALANEAPKRNRNGFETEKDGLVLDLKEITKILETHFLARLGERDRTIEIKEVRCSEKVILPPGPFSWDVLLPQQAYRGGSVTATIFLFVKGEEVRRIRVSARVDIYANVVTAKRYLKRHHLVQEEDLQIANRNVSLLAGDFITDTDQVVGKRTTLTINSQEVLRSGMIEQPPLLRKGDRVLLKIENPFFRITSWGEVREEGRKGDRIKLVNASSKKEVTGRILDGNTVLVDF